MPIDFAASKALFHLPDGVIYLDGNSLGPMVKTAPARVDAAVRDEWGDMLIRGWNKAGWMAQPRVLGDRIARLIGAEPGTVVLGDTLSIKVYQALASVDVTYKFLRPVPPDGRELTATAHVVHRGRTMAVANASAVKANKPMMPFQCRDMAVRSSARHMPPAAKCQRRPRCGLYSQVASSTAASPTPFGLV